MWLLRPISKPNSINNIFDFLILFFIFFNPLNIIRLSGRKNGLIGNYESFKKMWLLPTDVQTQGRKKNIFDFSTLFFIYFQPTQYNPIRGQKYWSIVKFETLKKCDYFRPIFKPNATKIFSIFPYFSFFFIPT